jgi:hypothetical protein
MTANIQRAFRAEEIVARYNEEYEGDGEDPATVLTDLLADLMHYTRKQFPRQWREVWDAIVTSAEHHHEAERGQGWRRDTTP